MNDDATARLRDHLEALSVDDLARGLAETPRSALDRVERRLGLRLRTGNMEKARASARLLRTKLRGLSPNGLEQLAVMVTAGPGSGLLSAANGLALDDPEGSRSFLCVLAETLSRWPVALVQIVLLMLQDRDELPELGLEQALSRSDLVAAVAERGSLPLEPETLYQLLGVDGLTRPAVSLEEGDDIPVGVLEEDVVTTDIVSTASRQTTEVLEDELDPASALAFLVAGHIHTSAGLAAEPLPPEVAVLALRAGIAGAPTDLSLWYTLGLAAAVAPDVTGDVHPPDRACSDAVWSGRLTMANRLGDVAAIVEAACRPAAELERLLRISSSRHYTAALLEAVITTDPKKATRLLRSTKRRFPSWAEVTAATRAAAARLADDGDLVLAEQLLVDVEASIFSWTEDRDEGLDEAALVCLERVALRRRRNDFVGGLRLLDDRGRAFRTPEARTRAATERALLGAEVADPLALVAPRTASERQRLARRLAPAAPALRTAAENEPNAAEPDLLLGLLALATGDDSGVVAHLGRAAALLADRPEHAVTRAMAVFERARALLRLLDPGTEAEATAAMLEALAAGHVPPEAALVESVLAASELEAPQLGSLVARAAEAHPRNPDLIAALLVSARRGDQAALAAAHLLAGNKAVPVATRFELLDAALAGTALAGTVDDVVKLVEEMDDVLARSGDDELDGRWAEALRTNPVLRDALDPAQADAVRIEALRRVGRLAEAREAKRSLFFKALAGSVRGFDPVELLIVLGEELGAAPEELDELRLALGGFAPAPVRAAPGVPVTVLFVGGNETQVRYRRVIEEVLAARHGGALRVCWFSEGAWSSNWPQLADRVEAAFPKADAVVMMTFIRTNLGRRLRASAGAAGLPWVSCTGHGRASLERAIEQATTVVSTRSARKAS